MKIFLNLCCATSAICLAAIAGGDLGISSPVAVVLSSNEGVARKVEKVDARKAPLNNALVFKPHGKARVVQYFDTYRNDPLGLPPGCLHNGTSARWSEPVVGRVIEERERIALVPAPTELARVLAAESKEEVSFYLVGRYLVAVDRNYKILDIVRIPTLRLGNEQDHVSDTNPLLVTVRHSNRKGQ